MALEQRDTLFKIKCEKDTLLCMFGFEQEEKQQTVHIFVYNEYISCA